MNNQLEKRKKRELQGKNIDEMFGNALANLSDDKKEEINNKIADIAVDIKADQINSQLQSKIAQDDIDDFIGNMETFDDAAGGRFTSIRQEGDFKTGSGRVKIKARKGSTICFVATEVYGDINAAQVETLRQFRDRYLLQNTLGKSFVRWYYRNGEEIASFISNKPILKKTIKSFLDILTSIIRMHIRYQ